MIRCKFMVTKIEENGLGSKIVTLETIYDPTIPEDQRFTKATPWGTMRQCIDNPKCFEPGSPNELKVGSYYYVDITRA